MNSRNIIAIDSHTAQFGENGLQYDFNSNHALLIGIDKYKNLPDLECAVADTEKVGGKLVGHLGFPAYQVRFLHNQEATIDNIYGKINELQSELTCEHNLLIYFAGHGTSIDGGTGAWQPHGAEEGKHTQILYSALIGDLLMPFKVRHLLVMSDCCYAGKLLAGSRAGFRSKAIEYPPITYNEKSRYILTSGKDHPVPDREADSDHSPFVNRFSAYIENFGGDYFCMDELAAYLDKKGICGASGFFPNDENRGRYWFIRRDAFERKLKQVEQAKAEADRLQKKHQLLEDLFRKAIPECDIPNEVFLYYGNQMKAGAWNGKALKTMEEVLKDWEAGILPSKYVSRVLHPIHFEDVKTDYLPAGNKTAPSVASTINSRVRSMVDEYKWLQFSACDKNQIKIPGFMISGKPVMFNHFKEFLDSKWYYKPDKQEDIPTWRGLWTEQGEQWHLRGGPERVSEGRSKLRGGYAAGVSWFEAVAFCNWLTWSSGGKELAYGQDGSFNPNAGYRLPLTLELDLVHTASEIKTSANAVWEWVVDRFEIDHMPWFAFNGVAILGEMEDDRPRVVFNTGGKGGESRCQGMDPGAGFKDVIFRIATGEMHNAD